MPEGENWERGVLDRLLKAFLDEQRRARRWSVTIRLLTLVLAFLVFFAAMGWLERPDGVHPGSHTAMVELRGEIASDRRASAENVIAGLQAAFKDTGTKGVILRINSPGGSPVQAGQIYDEIRRLRAKHEKIPLYAVVEDICASGGYYVAAAADRIYVDKASMVGSIGVLIDGFGFTAALDKLGVERRLITAGENKGFLDPFTPLDVRQKEYAQRMIDEIHAQFIDAVKQGRGGRLKESSELFSGLVWNGQKSVELGLADDLGSLEQVAREVIGAEEIVDFTPQENFAERLARRFGSSLGRGIGSLLLDSRALPR